MAMNPGNQYEFYTTGRETWESMLNSCIKAEKTIDIEQYIFNADEIGNQLIKILIDKVKVGVKVRMILDAVGSFTFYNSNVPDELRELGIEIRFFNPISPWRIHTFTSWIFRDHKKVLIVDGRVAFTGGTGIGVYMEDWRDTNARMEGLAVQEMQDSFDEVWSYVEERKIFARIKKVKISLKKRFFITSAPYFKKRFLYYVFIEALRGAKKSISITTPYFIPDRRIIRILRLAVRRGVVVKIIIPMHSDVQIVEIASNSSLGVLLRHGVKIYKYKKGILHAKTAVVDDEWGTFGSFNMDSLSFKYNFEANIVTTEKQCVTSLNKHFIDDISNSSEVIYKDWKNRSFIEKMKEFFVRPIRDFL